MLAVGQNILPTDPMCICVCQFGPSHCMVAEFLNELPQRTRQKCVIFLWSSHESQHSTTSVILYWLKQTQGPCRFMRGVIGSITKWKSSKSHWKEACGMRNIAVIMFGKYSLSQGCHSSRVSWEVMEAILEGGNRNDHCSLEMYCTNIFWLKTLEFRKTWI